MAGGDGRGAAHQLAQQYACLYVVDARHATLQLQEYQASAAQTAAVRSSSHARAAPSTSGSSFSRTSAW